MYSHPEKYINDPRLQGKFLSKYADDLLEASSYGGELELDILSKLYKTEIVVCDWTTRSLRTYEGGEGTAARVFLLYTSENHYDTLEKSMEEIKTPVYYLY